MNSDDIINSLHAADQNEPTESSPKVHLAILRCVLQIKTVVEQIKDKKQFGSTVGSFIQQRCYR